MSLRLSRRTLFASGGAAALAAGPVFAQTAPANDDASLAAAVDAYVAKCMAAWPDQPALGVAVVKDGATVLSRGYGVKVKGKPARADEHHVRPELWLRAERPRRHVVAFVRVGHHIMQL